MSREIFDNTVPRPSIGHLIGTEVHEVKRQYGARRFYLLQKYRFPADMGRRVGYELHVRRCDHLSEQNESVGDGELLTRYRGALLEGLLSQAKLDLDNGVLK